MCVNLTLTSVSEHEPIRWSELVRSIYIYTVYSVLYTVYIMYTVYTVQCTL